MISYTAYTYSRQEKIRYGVVGIVLGAIIGMLFFNRIPAVIALGGLGGMVYLKYYSRVLLRRQKDLMLMYQKEDLIIREFEYLTTQAGLHVPVEKLMLELGERSGIEDIRMFSEILMTAKKTGGNLVKIMKRTADNISEKIETKREIETVIAGKKMEARCMNVIPFGIIVYLRVFSPGFLDPLYGNLAGILIMTVSLMVYAGAFWWSYKITDISV